MKKTLIFALAMGLPGQASTQTIFQPILTEISANNPDLQAQQQAQQARQSGYRIGLTPYDPIISLIISWVFHAPEVIRLIF